LEFTGKLGGTASRWRALSLCIALAMGIVMVLSRTHGVNRVAASAMSTTPPLWNGVQSWVYQLTGYRNDRLDQIAYNSFDLAVVDLARDAGSSYFTAQEIAAVKASGKIVLAYFSIGSIEDYRPELPLVPLDIILGPVDGWPQERYVKYWDPRWWPIVQGRIDQALNAGFDGAYLDLIFAYEDIPANAAGTNREDLARKMVALIVQISQYAKSHNANFKIMPQNNPELYTWSYWNSVPNQDYINAIDGLAMENMYYQDDGTPCAADWCQENIGNAQAVHQAGKLVLSIDYPRTAAGVTDAYNRARAAGFIPYVSDRGLPSCYLYDVSPLTPCYNPPLVSPTATLPPSPTPTITVTRMPTPPGSPSTRPPSSQRVRPPQQQQKRRRP